tara:strand:+ start:801 stop:1463 length:663 start_codon:yes stop_codon:yes gene_type:complete
MHKIFRNVFDEIELIDFLRPKKEFISMTTGYKATDARIAKFVPFCPSTVSSDLKGKIVNKVQEALPHDGGYCFTESWSVQKYYDYELGKFDWHKDRIETNFNLAFREEHTAEENYLRTLMPQREASISIALNDRSEYEGGQFILDVGDGKRSAVDLDFGDMVIFDSDTLHGVEPVTKGMRNALIIWLTHKDKTIEWLEEVKDANCTKLVPTGLTELYDTL